MEVYAGFQENADWNVGRLLDAIEEMGDLENTLIFYIWGDNGASMEGTVTGSFNEMTFLNGVVLDPEQQLKLIEQYGGIDAIGGEHTAPHVAAAWAHAGNTPFQWGKQMASHLGGTRNPMVVAWPDAAQARHATCARSSRTASTSRPTVLEAAGIPEPNAGRRDRAGADGRHQLPLHARRRRRRPSATRFSTSSSPASRAIYKDGWWACAKLDRIPWDFSPETMKRFAPGVYDPEKDVWELYYLPDDFSQAHERRRPSIPDKLEELKELFWQEAERNRVLPLMGCMSIFFGILPPLPTITRFTFNGDVQNVQRGMVPRIIGRSYAIEAELEIPDGGAEGVIVANADFIGGFALWVDEQRKLHHTYSFLGVETYKQVSDRADPDRRGHREDAVRGRREHARHRRQGDAVGGREADRRGHDAADRAGRLLVLRRHGHQPRQRPRRRPRLRAQGAVRVHRARSSRSSSTSSPRSTTTSTRCTSTRASTRSRTESAPRRSPETGAVTALPSRCGGATTSGADGSQRPPLSDKTSRASVADNACPAARWRSLDPGFPHSRHPRRVRKRLVCATPVIPAPTALTEAPEAFAAGWAAATRPEREGWGLTFPWRGLLASRRIGR